VSTSLTFEYPLNERIRTFLRFEYLFEKVARFLPQEDPWMSRIAVEGVLDILTITTRGDIKTELLKELERNTNALNRMRHGPRVDPKTQEETLADLRQAISDLRKSSGQIGQSLRQDGFLKSIAKRNSIPGGTCGFDIPQYHYWLRQPLALRQQRLNDWMRNLQPMNNGVALVLSLARTSAEPREVTATGGFFQEALNIQAPAQLVRVTLMDNNHFFPEISGHRNRFSIRFMSMEGAGRPTPWQKDTTFILTCCVF